MRIHASTWPIFGFLLVCLLTSQAHAQLNGDEKAKTAPQLGRGNPPEAPAVTERKQASDTERIQALEDTLRAQAEQIEQLKVLIAEQSLMLKEIAGQRNAREATATVNATEVTSAPAVDESVDKRLANVEAQANKTKDELSRRLGSISFSGDLRLRFESIYGQSNALANGANPAVLGNELTPRHRARFRARLAMRGSVTEEFDWGLRMVTGTYPDNISTNQTLTDFFNRKPFAIDQAFVTYKPKQLPGLRLQGGKFAPPWPSTELTIDNDLMVEGFNQTYSRDFKGVFSNLSLAAWQLPMLERNSAFVRNSDGTVNVDQSRRGGRDLGLYGASVQGTFTPSSKVDLTLSAANLYFQGTQFITPVQVFGNSIQLPLTITIPASGTTPAQTITTQVSIPRDLLVAGNGNLGVSIASNNATNRDGRLSSGYNLVDLIAQLDLKHSKRFPVTLLFNFVTNTQTRDVVVAGPGGANLLLPNDQNNGYWAELQVGRNRERGDMQFGYTLMRIEKDAVLTPFNISDVTQQSDMRAHRLNFSYTTDPRVTFSIIGIVTQRPTGLLGVFGTTPPGSLNRPTTRLQFDTVLRF